MNANIMKAQIFIQLSFTTKGHLKISKSSFSEIIFCLTPDIFKTFQECQHYEDTNVS